MVLLGELDVWKFILPAMDDMKKTSLKDKKGTNIYDHLLNCLLEASPKIRLAVLLHDVGKVKTMENRKNFFGSQEFAEVIVEKNLGVSGLGYPKKVVKDVIRTIKGYDFNSHCLYSTKTIKKFIFENHDVIKDIIEIKTVIKNEHRSFNRRIKSAERLRSVYNDMLKNGAPFELKDLRINGEDVIKNFPRINIENLDDLLDAVLLKTALNPKTNNKQDLLVTVRKTINSNRDYYLDNDSSFNS